MIVLATLAQLSATSALALDMAGWLDRCFAHVESQFDDQLTPPERFKSHECGLNMLKVCQFSENPELCLAEYSIVMYSKAEEMRNELPQEVEARGKNDNFARELNRMLGEEPERWEGRLASCKRSLEGGSQDAWRAMATYLPSGDRDPNVVCEAVILPMMLSHLNRLRESVQLFRSAK